MRQIVIIALMLLAAPTQAEPWVVYGQTRVMEGMDNPAPNTAGLIGEIAALPYQVPSGKVLRIDGIGIESHHYQGAQPALVLFPWLSDYPMTSATPEYRAAASLVSCAAANHTNSCATRYYVPSGKWVNVRILASPASMIGLRMGWHLYGELEDAP